MPVLYNGTLGDFKRLFEHGPVIEIEIAVPRQVQTALETAGQQVPAPYNGYGLVDTGCRWSSTDNKVAIHLGLQPVNEGTMHTPAGKSDRVPVYGAAVNFPTVGAFNFESSMMFGTILDGQLAQLPNQPQMPLIALIGRDFLSRGILFYDGRSGMFRIAY